MRIHPIRDRLMRQSQDPPNTAQIDPINIQLDCLPSHCLWISVTRGLRRILAVTGLALIALAARCIMTDLHLAVGLGTMGTLHSCILHHPPDVCHSQNNVIADNLAYFQ